ncbi:Uncharacterised protein [Mycobacteroides abscessus subsp. abscessus]|nr:Uncharacterised protein [Mycobacteroides abscessus subsp. abscessus]
MTVTGSEPTLMTSPETWSSAMAPSPPMVMTGSGTYSASASRAASGLSVRV